MYVLYAVMYNCPKTLGNNEENHFACEIVKSLCRLTAFTAAFFLNLRLLATHQLQADIKASLESSPSKNFSVILVKYPCFPSGRDSTVCS